MGIRTERQQQHRKLRRGGARRAHARAGHLVSSCPQPNSAAGLGHAGHRLCGLRSLYAFDPNVRVELHGFTDVVGRHFRQPEDGLGLKDT